MNRNSNIINAVNNWIKLLIFAVIFEVLALFFTNLYLNEFLSGFDLKPDSIYNISVACVCFLIAAFAIIDLVLLKRIVRTQPLVNQLPIKCTVEDIVVISYKRDSNKKYNAYFILKDTVGNRLLFTYGKHSLSYYNYTVSQANKRLASVNVFRKNGSTVKLGDTVYAYVKRYVTVNAETNNNNLLLNNKKIHYNNINQNYNVDIFKELTFFEGAVEVEDISKN